MRIRLTALALLGMAAACGRGDGSASGNVIDRQTFISTYVDLRMAALDDPKVTVSDEQRAAILSRHGVDGESLLRFADVHGRDIRFMSDLWSEVDDSVQARSEEPVAR
jgi:hypothetical protein